jgi:hypothetical protein
VGVSEVTNVACGARAFARSTTPATRSSSWSFFDTEFRPPRASSTRSATRLSASRARLTLRRAPAAARPRQLAFAQQVDVRAGRGEGAFAARATHPRRVAVDDRPSLRARPACR